MQLWPAIDLLGGQVVRLHQGRCDQVTVYHSDPAAPAAAWRRVPRPLHAVDLYGARAGGPVRKDPVGRVVAALGPGVEVGGGVRDRAAIEAYLELGADRVVLGTAAIRDPRLVSDAAHAHAGRIVLALDAKAGRVATDGW